MEITQNNYCDFTVINLHERNKKTGKILIWWHIELLFAISQNWSDNNLMAHWITKEKQCFNCVLHG